MACLSGGDTEPRSAINHFVAHGSIFRDGIRFRTGVIITWWWTTAVGLKFPQLSLAKWNPLPSLAVNGCPCLIVVMLLHYHSMHTSTFFILHISASLERSICCGESLSVDWPEGYDLTESWVFLSPVLDLFRLGEWEASDSFATGCPSFLSKVCIRWNKRHKQLGVSGGVRRVRPNPPFAQASTKF